MVPHPSLLPQSELQAPQCSVRLCRADGSNGKGVGANANAAKTPEDFLCADKESHGEHGLQVEVILELKTHLLCCLRAFWLLTECKTSFM